MPDNSVQALLHHAVLVLKSAGIETPELDAGVLMSHILQRSRGDMLRHREQIPAPKIRRAFKVAVARRLTKEPIAYILGKKEFWGLDFLVNPATLIPRPDSETLIEAALRIAPERSRPLSILDMGTGSGCLLLSLLHEFPESNGVGVDISIEALHVARSSAARLGVAGRAGFVCGTWSAAIEGSFDLVMCNPPYVAEGDSGALMPDVIDHEPRRALFAGKDGLEAYRAVVPALPRLLKKNGHALLEIGEGQKEAVSNLLAQASLAVKEVRDDLAGIPRCIVAAVSPC